MDNYKSDNTSSDNSELIRTVTESGAVANEAADTALSAAEYAIKQSDERSEKLSNKVYETLTQAVNNSKTGSKKELKQLLEQFEKRQNEKSPSKLIFITMFLVLGLGAALFYGTELITENNINLKNSLSEQHLELEGAVVTLADHPIYHTPDLLLLKPAVEDEDKIDPNKQPLADIQEQLSAVQITATTIPEIISKTGSEVTEQLDGLVSKLVKIDNSSKSTEQIIEKTVLQQQELKQILSGLVEQVDTLNRESKQEKEPEIKIVEVVKIVEKVIEVKEEEVKVEIDNSKPKPYSYHRARR